MDAKILASIKSWCAGQERNRVETAQRLIKLGVDEEDKERYLDILEEEGFLNQARYAGLYAGSKFRTRQWGKNKIRYELEQKGFSDQEIRIALEEISQEEYLRTVSYLIEKEAGKRNADSILRKLCSKGFEEEVVQELIDHFGI